MGEGWIVLENKVYASFGKTTYPDGGRRKGRRGGMRSEAGKKKIVDVYRGGHLLPGRKKSADLLEKKKERAH